MIRPTLALNFARTGQLDRRITFGRSSAATEMDYAGVLRSLGIGKPRFDHDASGNCLGLLIEPQSTNQAEYSRIGDGTGWNVARATAAAATSITAPDGSNDAALLSDSASAPGSSFLYQSVFRATGDNCASIYVKRDPTATSSVASVTVTDSSVYFDLDTGTVTSSNDGGAIDAGNGWYRLYVTWVETEGYTGNVLFIKITGTTADLDTNRFYIWGAQLEAGTAPTSYIPTAAATATRAADSAILTGAGFDSWIHTEGTLLAKYKDAGWLYNDTPPTDSIDLTKYIDDYSTSAAGERIERLLFYPRTLTAAQRGKIML